MVGGDLCLRTWKGRRGSNHLLPSEPYRLPGANVDTGSTDIAAALKCGLDAVARWRLGRLSRLALRHRQEDAQWASAKTQESAGDGVALVNSQDPHRLPDLPQGRRCLSRHETEGTAVTRLAADPAAKAVARLHHHHAVGGHPPERPELA